MLLTAGRYRQFVNLDDPVEDGTPVTFVPSRVKCDIQPVGPGAFDENKTTHVVNLRYHPQITFNTRLTFVDRANVTHKLYVRGVQNVRMLNRELVLLCEEVMTP